MMKLICFDMDGVIFRHTDFWLDLHKALGTYEQGKRLTYKYLKKDYDKLVAEVVVGLWKGRSAEKYFELVHKAKYIKGVRDMFEQIKKKHLKTVIITSGPLHLAVRAKKELGVDYIFSNELLIRNNVITGKFKWPVGCGTEEKLRILLGLVRRLGISLKDVVCVGNDENDVGVCEKVGLSIAFNSKSELLNRVCKVVIKEKDLRLILPYLE